MECQAAGPTKLLVVPIRRLIPDLGNPGKEAFRKDKIQ
eukprot:TCALIF_05930-PA protein Name:"Protein of unknown function" AED:0.08 eAED:0.08 QI:0/0.5/0.33/0.66/0.5/0.33/3/2063/37